MKGFLFDVEFMWGFQARIAGMAKSSPSYIFPPPTSILGSLAESYARRKGLSESKSVETMRELSNVLLTLAYKPCNAVPIVVQDLNRIIAIRTAAGVSYPSLMDVYGSFDAPARGKTILSSINNEPPILRVMLVFKEGSDVIVDDIWRMKRIGSKESMISVIKVVEGIPEILKDGIIKTKYSFPHIDGMDWDHDGEYVEQYFVPPIPILGQSLVDSPSALYLRSQVVKYVIGVPYRDYQFRIKKLPPGFVGYKIGEEVAIGIEG